MANGYRIRMGDSTTEYHSKDRIMGDIEAGTNDAAELGDIPALSDDDKERIADILMSPQKMVSVDRGNEVPVTHDIGTLRIDGDQGNSGTGIPASRLTGVMTHERAFGTDTMELGHIDYSFKPVKPVVSQECQTMEVCQQNMTVPLLYGAMPNMGLYYQPDGPFKNPSDLMREFKLQEAKEQIEGAADELTNDMVWTVDKLYKSASDGVNFDTIGAAGDGDFYASVQAIEALRKRFPNIYIEAGMASESVLGMHGEFEYDGTTLAGLWPHEQAPLIGKAGANLYGPVCNTSTGNSTSWNLARAVTFIKAAVESSPIPCHVNMGMGVGGIPMFETPPVDAVTRCSKAMVEVAGVDGI